MGTTFSSYLEILRNVPQGSVLGPILFNLFISNFMFSIKKTEVFNFADDTTIYSCSLNYEEAHRKLSDNTTSSLVQFSKNSLLLIAKLCAGNEVADDTHIVPNWFRINSMVANPGKFQIIFLGSSINNNDIFIVENKLIKSNNKAKLLGITIDRKLTFTKYINNLCNTASTTFENFDKNKKIFSSRANKTSF